MSRRKSLLLLGSILLVLTFCSLPRSNAVRATPPYPPCRFSGTVKVYGEWVPEGTLLMAIVEGAETIVPTQTTLLYDNVSGQNISVYNLDVQGDDPDTPEKDGGALGDEVYFDIEYEGVILHMAEVGLWITGGFPYLDLTVPLQATLSGQPTGVVNYSTADIMVSGDGVVAYKYKVDDGSWSQEISLETHISLSGLGDGAHTVYAIGKNAAGNWRQPEAAATTASWVVDTTPPAVALSGQPTGVANYSTADITVGGADVVAYKYKLDSGQWSGETVVGAHIVLSGLGDGQHMVYVIGKDAVGNWQAKAEASLAGWVVDITPPLAALLGQPTGTVNYNTSEIIVYGTDMVAYRWKLDSNSWSETQPLSDPIALSGLNDGYHTIYVMGQDAVGNWQGEATTASWSVDTVPPVATLSGEPLGTVNYNSADIVVSGTDVVAYKYRLDAGLWSVEIPAGNPITLSGLSDGAHTVYVQGRDDAGNWQGEEDASLVSWTIDTTPPRVPALIFPALSAKLKNSPLSLQWAAVDDPSGVRYNLQVSLNPEFSLLDMNVEGQDSSSYSTTALEHGTYYWRVKAVDGVGNESGWSESRSFKLGGAGGAGWWVVALAIVVVATCAVGAIFWRRRQVGKI